MAVTNIYPTMYNCVTSGSNLKRGKMIEKEKYSFKHNNYKYNIIVG